MSGWAANWETSEGKGKLLMPALNDLRGALAERCAAANRTVSALCPEVGTGDIILSSWFSAFHAQITYLIPLFANHLDNDGDWTGISTPDGWTRNDNPAQSLPAWSEATILTAIGDPIRIPAPRDPLISATWMFQQYNILNLLRWARHKLLRYDSAQDRRGNPTEPPWDWSFAAVKPRFNAAVWTSGALGVYEQPYYLYHGPFLGEYEMDAKKFNGKVTLTNPDASTLQRSTDFYYSLVAGIPSRSTDDRLRAIGIFGLPLDGHDGDARIYGGGFTLPVKHLKTSNAESGGLEIVSDDYLINGIADIVCNHDQPDMSISASLQVSLARIGAILKFDGANGFQYKNW